MKHRRTVPSTALLLPFAFFCTGCGFTGSLIGGAGNPIPVTPAPTPGTYAGSAFSGKVFAGQMPISGSSVQLYAAGSIGNGIGAKPLLAAAITDAAGTFAVPAGYLCPLASSQLYLVASGGQVASAPNPSISLLTALGSCNAIATSSRFTVNEATTAAAVWPLAQFLAPGGVIGSSATNASGLANAFSIAQSLASSTTGSSPGPTFPANGSSPSSRIDSLADLLNTCTASASSCSRLFALTLPAANTLDAAISLVQHPAANVLPLYTLSTASTAFAPVLAAAPPDWTFSSTFSGGGLSSPSSLGITASGSIWVANYDSVASAFSPLGEPLFPTGIAGSGLYHSYGLAIDAADHAWITNEPSPNTTASLTELTSTGSALSGASGYTTANLDLPLAIAIDPDQSVWIADYGTSHITHLSSSGAPLSGSGGYASSQIDFPVAIAIDSSSNAHSVWIANGSGTTITRLSQDGATATSVSCCNAPAGLAIDPRGHVWAANFYGDSVSEVSPSLTLESPGFTAPSISRPKGIAIDGSGNVWIASYRNTGITELAGSQTASPGAILSPASGWASDAPLLEAYALAIDASGNVWVSSFGSSTLTGIVGLAAPVATPVIGPATAP